MGSFTWGYDDKSLFKRYFDVNANETSKPSFQVILTVSTHSPFLINNQSVYTQNYCNIVKVQRLE
jgi:uncharacterized sulfatase